MNIFLNELDVKMNECMKEEPSLCYVRYTDDMIIGIKRDKDSQEVYKRWRKLFSKALEA